MSSRLDRQDQNVAGALIESISNDIRELKTRQSIPRALTSKTYVTANPGTWDLTGVSVPAGGSDSYLARWTSDGNQPSPFPQYYVQVTQSGTTLTNYGYRTSALGGYVLGPPTSTVGNFNKFGQLQFARQITLYAPTSSTGIFNIKVSVLGTTKGVLEVF